MRDHQQPLETLSDMQILDGSGRDSERHLATIRHSEKHEET